MCGIAGILRLDARPSDAADLLPVIDALAHRGPDGAGICSHGPIALGHRRLAILDLSDAGKQPMHFADRYCITFNGEIYNFVELREDLEKLGHKFRTDTDTEVLVAAYDQWGPDACLKFNGMWAFAIWDLQKRELFLSRDRFGVKPLYYHSEPGRFTFASELKGFLYLHDFTPRENQNESRHQLATGMDSSEQTLLEGVKTLRPGHNMLVSRAGIRISRWWCTLDHRVEVPKRFPQQVEQFRELFFDACRLRLRSDVPVATCLSGGLDSSSILCSLAATNQQSTKRIAGDFHRAFVAIFANSEHDELQYAEAAIAQAGADPRYRTMDCSGLIEDLPSYAYDYECIGGQGLLLPVWALYRELRRDGVIVSLDGLGSDELFMGYPRTIRAWLRQHGNLLTNPRRTLDLARTLQRILPDQSLGRVLSESDPVLRTLVTAMRSAKRFLRPAPVRTEMPQSAFLESEGTADDETDAYERNAMNSLSPMSRELYRQFHHEANWLLLHRYDRISMAHGIEVRLPFMDWRLVTYAFSLPDESKGGGGYSKRILREAMRGILPDKIRTRTPKIGFQAPLYEWMNGALGDWVYERSRESRFLENPVADGPALRDYIARRHAAKDWNGRDARIVWRHVQADLWRETFFTAKQKAATAAGQESRL